MNNSNNNNNWTGGRLTLEERRAYGRRERDPEGLYRAAARGNLPAVRAAINRGDPINGKVGQMTRKTPLMVAAQLGHVNVVRELLNKGAHVNARNAMGMTALHQAVFGGRPSAPAVIKLLMNKGAKPLHRDGSYVGGPNAPTLAQRRDPKSPWYMRTAAEQGASWRPGNVAARNAVATGIIMKHLIPQRKEHAARMLELLFRGKLPAHLSRYMANLSGLQKKWSRVPRVARLTASSTRNRSPNRSPTKNRSPNRSSTRNRSPK